MGNRLFILSNSPGEVSGWVKPVAEQIADGGINASVTLVVLPCQYASGQEKLYGGTLNGIDNSLSFGDLWKNSKRGGRSAVLQMGGDPMFGAALSAKLKAAWMIYTSRPRWRSRVNHYFIPDTNAENRFIKARVDKSRYSLVGNLILDSVPRGLSTDEARASLGLARGEKAITFMSGSRPFEYEYVCPFFCRAAGVIAERHRGIRIFMPLAPTVNEAILRGGLSNAGISWCGGEHVEKICLGENSQIDFIRGHTFSALKASELAIALPGTNNLQTASLGVPLIMVAPLNRAEDIPLDGLPGLVPTNFRLTKNLKRKIVMYFNKREKYVCLTNRTAGRGIVPEYRRIMSPETVAGLIDDLLNSPEKLSEIRDGYSLIKFEYGAAARIAAKVREYFA